MSPAQMRKTSRHSTSALATAATSARAPRRCRKCPNKPLKSTCGCSKRRNVVLNTESGLASGLSLSLSTSSAVSTTTPLNAASTTEDIHASSAVEGLVSLQGGGNSWDVLQGFPANVQEHLGIHQEPAEPHHSLPPPNTIAINHDIVINPALLVDEQRPVSVPEVTGIEHEDEDYDRDYNDVGKKIGKRLTLTEKAARYGLVNGIMRGNTVYRVVRQNDKRRPILDASSATTRYNREIPLIISRAERMALETDAYVLILAQQATGSSASIHFASERLRREAFGESAALVNKFQSLMTQLVTAKRSTTLALTQNLEASERARAQVEEQLVERESVVAFTEAELAASRRANQALLLELEALRSSAAGGSQQSD
ncbi:hypothetical protein Agabi119p4_10714 [Agaricus bisporus var. burnettii]|uniref:Uncharacterized protein n=1 Tax=Agaricus bisporus var. burnettii TaxID=192524 RepID=A0A8H7EX75_AGABI|nr:hypothetical protein Agabi119p4_10714 [Agaricus bisporus var. burnettii]